jgi:uncharacterized protein (DUF779 family)
MKETVTATKAAHDMIVQLKARYGSLMFMQSGGCCDGSAPTCLQEGDLLLGPGDLLLGEIVECPFYIDQEQYERWNRPQFLIDVVPGSNDTFSLEGPEGMHFIARTELCQIPHRKLPHKQAA